MQVSMRLDPELWDTVPGTQVLKTADAYRTRGIDVAPTLALFGIAPDIKPDTPIELRRAVDWLEYVLTEHPERGLGLVFARLPSILDSGIVGYTVLSSETVGEALAERVKFAALLRPNFGVTVESIDPGMIEVALVERDPPFLGPRARVFCMERDLAAWAGAWDLLTGSGPPFEAVHLAYQDPQIPDRYREVFRCPVRFEQPRSLVRLRREVLDMPMRHAHGEAHRLCAEQCELLLARMRSGNSTAASVRRLLLQRPRALLDLQATATALGLGERTLARRLSEEGSSFQQLLTEVRMTLAGDYIRATPLAITDIAKLLGYGDESSFSRAFRRSTGLTPRAFRTQGKAPP